MERFVWDIGEEQYDENGVLIDREDWIEPYTWAMYGRWINHIRDALARPDKLDSFWVLKTDERHVIATIRYGVMEVSFAISQMDTYIYSYAIGDTTYYFSDALYKRTLTFEGTKSEELHFSSQYSLLGGPSHRPSLGLHSIRIAVTNLFYKDENLMKKSIFLMLHVVAEAVRFNYFERAVALDQNLESKASCVRTTWAHLCDRIERTHKKGRDAFEVPLAMGRAENEDVMVLSISEAKEYVSLIKLNNEDMVQETNKKPKGKKSRASALRDRDGESTYSGNQSIFLCSPLMVLATSFFGATPTGFRSFGYGADAILNGVEVMKMNNSMGSLEGELSAKSVMKSCSRASGGVSVLLIAAVCILLAASVVLHRRRTGANDTIAWSQLPVDITEVYFKRGSQK